MINRVIVPCTSRGQSLLIGVGGGGRRYSNKFCHRQLASSATKAETDQNIDDSRMKNPPELKPFTPGEMPPPYDLKKGAPGPLPQPNKFGRYRNRGHHDGYGPRKYEYENLSAFVKELPTASEKIEFVNPHEREFTKFEAHRHSHDLPRLYPARKAYEVLTAPRAYDSLEYYAFLTKTHVVERDTADETNDFVINKEHEKLILTPVHRRGTVTENTAKILFMKLKDKNGSTSVNEHVASEQYAKSQQSDLTPKQRTAAASDSFDEFCAHLIDNLVVNLAAEVPHFKDMTISRGARLSSFWTRGGFQTLYDLDMNLHRKLKADNRMRHGELAFRFEQKVPLILRCATPLQPIVERSFSAPVEPRQVYPPEALSLFPDTVDLDQVSGSEVSVGDPNDFVHTQFVYAQPIVDRYETFWLGSDELETEDDERVLEQSLVAGAMINSFASCTAQAHALGFTQYNDLTYPITTNTIISDGRVFLFVRYQLNTLNMAHDWTEIQTIDKFCRHQFNDEHEQLPDVNKNVCWFDGPYELYDEKLIDNKSDQSASQTVHRTYNSESTSATTRRLLQVLCEPFVTKSTEHIDLDCLRPYLKERVRPMAHVHHEEDSWGQHFVTSYKGTRGKDYVSDSCPPLDYGHKRVI